MINKTLLKIWFSKYKYRVAVLTIIILAVFFRVYNYSTRWGLSADDSRDALIALEAIKRKEMPLIGPFSSAGPFVFGPIYFWIIMASYLIFPFSFISPWIIVTLLGILAVFVMIKLGESIESKSAALILGALTAFSPQFTVRSAYLIQYTFVSFFTAFILFFLAQAWKTKKMLYSALFGLFIGLSLNIHYQAINLLFLFPALLFLPIKFKSKIIHVICASAFFALPAIPILIWDSRQGYANLRNIADFFLIGQYRFYVASSWKIFLGITLSEYWMSVTGGIKLFSYFLMASSGLFVLYNNIKTKKLFSLINILAGVFIFLLILNRYYRGERYEGYLTYFAPFILLFSGLTLNAIYKNFKLFGVILTLIILAGSFTLLHQRIVQSNNGVGFLNEVATQLQKDFPNKKFSVYDQNYSLPEKSQPLSFVLKTHNLTSTNGLSIGICKKCSNEKIPQIAKSVNFEIVDLSNLDADALEKTGWGGVNSENLYDDLIGWSKKNNLKSTFYIEKYLLDRLNIKAQ